VFMEEDLKKFQVLTEMNDCTTESCISSLH